MITEVEAVENIVPEVGEMWKHPNDREVYLRIRDENGQKALPGASGTYLFSVRVKDGNICSTSPDANFIMLEPIGGEPLMLQVKK